MCFLKTYLEMSGGRETWKILWQMSCIDPTIGFWIEDFAGMPRSVGCSAASWIRCLV